MSVNQYEFGYCEQKVRFICRRRWRRRIFFPQILTQTVNLFIQAGAVASTSVDVAMFPLDTLKTRMQSRQGLWMAGGFRGIYSGLLAAAIGSAPSGKQCLSFILIGCWNASMNGIGYDILLSCYNQPHTDGHHFFKSGNLIHNNFHFVTVLLSPLNLTGTKRICWRESILQ